MFMKWIRDMDAFYAEMNVPMEDGPQADGKRTYIEEARSITSTSYSRAGVFSYLKGRIDDSDIPDDDKFQTRRYLQRMKDKWVDTTDTCLVEMQVHTMIILKALATKEKSPHIEKYQWLEDIQAGILLEGKGYLNTMRGIVEDVYTKEYESWRSNCHSILNHMEKYWGIEGRILPNWQVQGALMNMLRNAYVFQARIVRQRVKTEKGYDKRVNEIIAEGVKEGLLGLRTEIQGWSDDQEEKGGFDYKDYRVLTGILGYVDRQWKWQNHHKGNMGEVRSLIYQVLRSVNEGRVLPQLYEIHYSALARNMMALLGAYGMVDRLRCCILKTYSEEEPERKELEEDLREIAYTCDGLSFLSREQQEGELSYVEGLAAKILRNTNDNGLLLSKGGGE